MGAVRSPAAWFHPNSSEAVMKVRNPEHRDNCMWRQMLAKLVDIRGRVNPFGVFLFHSEGST